MSFNSLEFLLFFPLVALLFFTIKHKYRWLLLLLSSYIFYMAWNANYALLILSSTIVTYLSGLYLEKFNSIADDRKKAALKRACVAASFTVNLGILAFFKYANFFVESINDIMAISQSGEGFSSLDIILPIGISFYTFQALSYTMDVYRGQVKAQKHFGKYALFVSFFPQLVAGPIERSTNLLYQFDKQQSFDLERIRSGFIIVLIGFFKKIVIADRLAVFVNAVYSNPESYDSGTLIIATVFFSFQIYCDFSGYSDIAIGTARILGFDLMQNFKRPYFSRSISEFWRNWHISLSTWFKDYLYIPLGGNRVGRARLYFNLLVVFLLSGLWHGASWNFVIWGALHGAMLILAIATKPMWTSLYKAIGLTQENKLLQIIQIILTFCLITISWIFFRANTLSDAKYILINSLSIPEFNINAIPVEDSTFFISIGLCVFLILYQFVDQKTSIQVRLPKLGLAIRWAMYITAILLIIFWGYYPYHSAQFIYFQF